MNKIGFVSIILLAGLFSLQFNLGHKLKNQMNPPQTVASHPNITTVKYSPETNRIVYVYPTDKIVVIQQEIEVCTKEMYTSKL
jgi:hypothetical protein